MPTDEALDVAAAALIRRLPATLTPATSRTLSFGGGVMPSAAAAEDPPPPPLRCLKYVEGLSSLSSRQEVSYDSVSGLVCLWASSSFQPSSRSCGGPAARAGFERNDSEPRALPGERVT